MLGQNSGENSIPPVVRTGAMYGGVTYWRDTPRNTEMFLGRERKRNSVTGNLRENVPSRELRLIRQEV